jgi:predicted regulator of amino acid metabolism with ACT domain
MPQITPEDLQKITEAEKKVVQAVAEIIFKNLDKVLEQISSENFLKELKKRIKKGEIKVDLDQTEKAKVIRYLVFKDYKLDLLKI